jgi:GTPase Era involved in 16S rRNA processing
VVDIPGINEAGAGSKYRNFVAQKWHTFDVVVLVMDGKQGVNTEEQIKMLQFVKENQEKRREIPLIILLNKVDDPDDSEQSVLVEESRKELERLFSPSETTREYWKKCCNRLLPREAAAAGSFLLF